MKAFVLAGTKSGGGKTTLTLAVLAALVRRGLKTAAFKVGPDFIDPGHHARITGRPSRNLDGWMLSRAYNQACFARETTGAKAVDAVVVEGVMGLYDGYDGRSEAGSTAQMAKWLGLPVVLVVNAKSMARSAAAVVKGFETFDPEVSFAGVVFNEVGSPRHRQYLEQALAGHVRMPCLGAMARRPELTIPERHLGLHTAGDHPLTDAAVNALADLAETALDLDKLLAASDGRPVGGPSGSKPVFHTLSSRARIGVARDRAFCFYYQDNLDLLEAAGAEIVFFSPLADPVPPAGLDGLYLGGGYPELHAARLSQNRSMTRAVSAAAQNGLPIYAECGGFMYLGESLRDLDGRAHPMTGCLPITFAMRDTLQSLGYREITLAADTLVGQAGQTLRGHEFHYSRILSGGRALPSVYQVSTRAGAKRQASGFQTRRCLGSYVHLHFGSHPAAARALVSACRAYHSERSRFHDP